MTQNIPQPAAQTFPKDAAKVIFWFKGLPQPIGFLLTTKDADRLQTAFTDGEPVLTFQSYPDNSGTRSTTTFPSAEVRGISVEVNSIQLV